MLLLLGRSMGPIQGGSDSSNIPLPLVPTEAVDDHALTDLMNHNIE